MARIGRMVILNTNQFQAPRNAVGVTGCLPCRTRSAASSRARIGIWLRRSAVGTLEKGSKEKMARTDFSPASQAAAEQLAETHASLTVGPRKAGRCCVVEYHDDNVHHRDFFKPDSSRARRQFQHDLAAKHPANVIGRLILPASGRPSGRTQQQAGNSFQDRCDKDPTHSVQYLLLSFVSLHRASAVPPSCVIVFAATRVRQVPGASRLTSLPESQCIPRLGLRLDRPLFYCARPQLALP